MDKTISKKSVDIVRKEIHAIIGDGTTQRDITGKRQELQLLADDLFKRNKTDETIQTIKHLERIGIHRTGASGDSPFGASLEEEEAAAAAASAAVGGGLVPKTPRSSAGGGAGPKTPKSERQLHFQTPTARSRAGSVVSIPKTPHMSPRSFAASIPTHDSESGSGSALAPRERIVSNADYGKGLKKKTFIYTEAKASRGRLGEVEVHDMIMDGGVNYPTIDTDRRGHKGNLKSEREKLYPITTFFRGKNLTPANDLRKYCMKAPKTRQAWKLLKDNSDIARFYNESRGGYKSIGGERPRASVTFYNPVNPGK